MQMNAGNRQVEPIRILIAEDHPMFREGLELSLRAAADMELIGTAISGDEAIRLAQTLQPDVILMDIQMPVRTGIEATREILRHSPHIGIVILTMHSNDDMVFAALCAGARGYLVKDATQAEILRAVRAVYDGEAIFGPSIAQRIVHYFAALQERPKPLFPELTEREHEILGLLTRGYSNAQIAKYLVLSEKTVRNHLSNIFSKLQVTDRTQAILRAQAAGLDGARS